MTHEEELLHKRLKRLLKNSDGQVTFKNYTELCNQLKLPVKTSDSKKAQLKKLKYFCNLEPGDTKNSLTYTIVYTDPDNNILEEKFMVKSIETLLLATFLKQEDTPPSLILDTFSLWKLFGFINERYGNDKEEQIYLQQNNIAEIQLHNFKRRTRRRFEDLITPALNQLSNRALIHYNSTKIIYQKVKNNVIMRAANEEEVTRILSYERRALRHFKCEDITSIWNKSLELEYYSYLNNLIRSEEQEEGWVKVSNGIKIITNNKKWLRDGLDKNIDELEVRYNVNQEILNLLQKNAETKMDNYLSQVNKEYENFKKLGTSFQKVKHRLPTYKKMHEAMNEKYLESQEALMNYFIDIM